MGPKANKRTGEVLIPTVWSLLAAEIERSRASLEHCSGGPAALALAELVAEASEHE